MVRTSPRLQKDVDYAEEGRRRSCGAWMEGRG